MLNRIISDIKSTPERLRAAPADLNQRRRQASRWARERVHLARGESRARLWVLGARALERADAAIDRTVNVTLLGRLTTPAASFLNSRVSAYTAVPIEDFATMNVRVASKAITELPRLDLIRVRRFEAQNKARTTLLNAIDREIKKRDQLPEVPVALAA